MGKLDAFLLLVVVGLFSGSGWCQTSTKEVQMARYIMHKVDWISIATISTIKSIEGYPFANLKSVSDGTKNNSTGVPYLLMTDMDLSGADVKKNNAVTIMASLAEKNDCSDKKFDPQDPRCGRLLISGKLIKLNNDTEEGIFAKDALFQRHPIMRVWVEVHKFYFAKIAMENILLLDHFGGAVKIDLDDYLQAKLTSWWEQEEEVVVRKTKFFFNAF